jgi:hypothetical protein
MPAFLHPRPLALCLVAAAGCGGAQYLVTTRPPVPFEVAIVPGCPNEDDGALSRCQKGRALWAAVLWRRGEVERFIVSGNAVHSPFVEAEGLAEAMVALGVPPDRVWIEPNALHTDENIYLSLQIARALGLRRVAVASSRGQAESGCVMVTVWGPPGCGALPFDEPEMRALDRAAPGVLERIRSREVAPWPTLLERERAIAHRTHRHRPPSFILYPYLAVLRLLGLGGTWVPANVPPRPPLVTWKALRG